MQLNFDSFMSPVTDADIKKYAAEETSWLTPTTIVIASVVILGVLPIPALFGLVIGGTIFEVVGMVQLVLVTLIAVAVIVAMILIVKLSARETVKMKRFAEANKIVYTKGANPAGLHGLIFDNGHTRRIDGSYAFPDGLELGNYQYTTGSGKNQSTHMFGYARVSLGRNLPNMVLDAKGNDFLGSSLPDSFQSSQRMTLEGNFNDHFDLYVPENYQRDALYIFTPDVMQALLDNGKDFDIEVVGNELYLYSKRTISMTSALDLRRWIGVVESISSELKDQSKRYVDERMFESHSAAPAMPEVASGGKRLKQSYKGAAIFLFVGFVFMVFMPGLLPPEIGNIVASVGWLTVFAGLFIWVILKMTRIIR